MASDSKPLTNRAFQFFFIEIRFFMITFLLRQG